MYSIDLPETARFEAYGMLSILADGRDGVRDRLVAIGVGYVDEPGSPEVQIHTLADTRGDVGALVDEAFDWLSRRECEALFTYDGAGFDMPFLRKKLVALGRETFYRKIGKSFPVIMVSERSSSKSNYDRRTTAAPSISSGPFPRQMSFPQRSASI